MVTRNGRCHTGFSFMIIGLLREYHILRMKSEIVFSDAFLSKSRKGWYCFVSAFLLS